MPRIFVAVPVPEVVRSSIASVARTASHALLPSQASNLRWVRRDQYHITLKFLGDITEPQVQSVTDAVAAATAEWARPIHLSARGIGAFPHLERARVLWVGTQGDVTLLRMLQQQVETRLVSRGFDSSNQPFKPHITIARLRQPGPIPSPLLEYTDHVFGDWDVPCIQVIESQLSSAGPRYIVRHEISLP